MTERNLPHGTGTAGTTGTGLNAKGYSGPTRSGHSGTSGTACRSAGEVVPVVPDRLTRAGPEKLNENSPVPVVPMVPPDLRRRGVGEQVAAALGAVFAPAPVEPGEDDRAVFEERSAIAEHDGGLGRDEAEVMAAREQGYETADALRGAVVAGWARKIDCLVERSRADPEIARALDEARAFVREGWALQAVRLGWGELELFGVSAEASSRRRAWIGAAFGGAVHAVTTDAIIRSGGRWSCRAAVESKSAVPIWEAVGKV